MQKRRNRNALELRFFCIEPSIYEEHLQAAFDFQRYAINVYKHDYEQLSL